MKLFFTVPFSITSFFIHSFLCHNVENSSSSDHADVEPSIGKIWKIRQSIKEKDQVFLSIRIKMPDTMKGESLLLFLQEVKKKPPLSQSLLW